MTAMRKKACGLIQCNIPDNEDSNFKFTPLVHLLTGGKMSDFSGVIPGIWEEFLHAFEAKKPTFIVGASRRAAGKIAQWLNEPPEKRPEELTYDYFIRTAKDPKVLCRLARDIEKNSPNQAPQRQLDRLWEYIATQNKIPNKKEIPDNGLNPEENKMLFTSPDFAEIAINRESSVCIEGTQD